MAFTDEDKLLIVKLWYKHESGVKVKRAFCKQKGIHTEKGPSKLTIIRTVKHFEEHLTLKNTSKGNSGRPPLVTKNANVIEQVRTSLDESPKKSIRQRSSEITLSFSSVQRILRKELKVFP